MSTGPPRQAARPADFSVLNRPNATAFAYWSGMLMMAAVLAALWFRRGPAHPAFAAMMALWTFVLGPGLALPVMRRVPPRWCHVPARERVLHRMLGVHVFGWLLERSGYNRRFVHPMWDFSINQAGLPFRTLAAQGGASAHGACFAIHVVLAVLALSTGSAWGALGILLPGAVIHLYPVLLQRSILLRLQLLMEKRAVKERAM